MKKKHGVIIVLVALTGVTLFLLGMYRSISEEHYFLPSSLKEIFGITYLGNNRLVAIEDETGALYVYDLKTQSIVEKISFGTPGDYEDIAAVEGSFYILRSDGALFEFRDGEVLSYDFGIHAKNSEGLAYDPSARSLLIATKSKVAAGKEFKDKRYVYAFDIATKKVSEEPVLVIDVEEIQTYVEEHGIELDAKDSKKAVKFRPSGIAVHPVTKNLYILSAIDHILIVVNRDGAIMRATQLDKNEFNQPEGIAFLDNGEIVIANEGGDESASLFIT